MTEKKSLGRRKFSFPGKKISWTDFLLWSMPGVLIPLVLIYIGAYEQYFGNRYSDLIPYAWYLLAAISLIPFAIMSIHRFKSSGKRIAIHENGVRLINIDPKVGKLLWRQITGIRTDHTTYHLFGFAIGKSNSIIIEPVIGREIQITNEIKGLDKLAERIKANIYPILLPSMKAELEQGQTVSFGPIEFNKQEIIANNKSIPWHYVQTLNIESGSLILNCENQRPITLLVNEVPNIELFLQLINSEVLND